MKYLSILLFLIISIVANAHAAWNSHFIWDTTRVVADTDSVFRKNSVSVGANYGSDIQFFGRTGPKKYPFLSTDVIYNFKNGIFVYAAGFEVLGYNPVVDEIDLGAGYLFNYSKKLTGTLSYTRFFFDKDAAQVIKSASSNDINFKNSFNWKFAKSSVTFDYLFGKVNDYFITLNVSKYIEPNWSIFDDRDYLSFNPTISAILGTQNFVGRYFSDHLGSFDPYTGRNPGPPELPDYDNGRFNVLNYSVKLPIAYNRPHYTFEASWKYSIPVNVENQLKNHHEVFFNLTFYYLFY